jgi:hypothetical protein
MADTRGVGNAPENPLEVDVGKSPPVALLSLSRVAAEDRGVAV